MTIERKPQKNRATGQLPDSEAAHGFPARSKLTKLTFKHKG
jgi:hypothetical protein